MPAAYQRNLLAFDSAAAAVQFSVAHRAPEAVRRGAFQRARLAWKAVEFLAEYFSPSLTKQLNGPARPEVESYGQQQQLRQCLELIA